MLSDQINDMITASDSSYQETNMQWRSRRENGNEFAKYAGAAVFAPLIFSGAIEFGQSYLTNYRGGELADFVFNSLGVILAALFSICVTRPLMKKYNISCLPVVDGDDLKGLITTDRISHLISNY